jgi:hypothetical protein
MVNADSINEFIINTVTSEAERLRASTEIQETLDRLILRVSSRNSGRGVTNHAADEISSSADYGYGDTVLDWLTQIDEESGTITKPAGNEVKEFEDQVKDTMYDIADFLRALNRQRLLHIEVTT